MKNHWSQNSITTKKQNFQQDKEIAAAASKRQFSWGSNPSHTFEQSLAPVFRWNRTVLMDKLEFKRFGKSIVNVKFIYRLAMLHNFLKKAVF